MSYWMCVVCGMCEGEGFCGCDDDDDIATDENSSGLPSDDSGYGG